MENHEMVIHSEEKHQSHKRINAFFMPWIEHHIRNDSDAVLATMPAQSGLQENVLLDYIEQQDRRQRNNVKLLTFDTCLAWKETNIKQHHKRTRWEHHVSDIFAGLLEHSVSGPHAVWFDLTGGLSDKNLKGITDCVDQLFVSGSLMFVTFQIHAVRCLSGNSTFQTYHMTSNTPVGNVIHTERLLESAVKQKCVGKTIVRVMPTFTYKSNTPTTWGVFGYIVK